MPPNEAPRALCVSLHDVASATWPECLRLLEAVRAVAPIPLTLLVVPHYHRLAVADEGAFRRALAQRLAGGDELALHGYTHLDEGPAPRGPYARWLRHVYTTGEGEFSALDEEQARERIERGLEWFAARRWTVSGFVAPAWLLGRGAWRALRQFSFLYTTTLGGIHHLALGRTCRSPSLVYAARNPAGRWLSCRRNEWLLERLEPCPVIRLGLHPQDARHPQLVRHCQHLIERALASRRALTKSAFAQQMQPVFDREFPACFARPA